MNVLIRSAIVINPEGEHHLKTRDIAISNGKIIAIKPKISSDEFSADQSISHKNLHLSYGWMDSGVHLGEPGYEERESINNGLQVAAKNGFTSLLLNPVTKPECDNSGSIRLIQNLSKGHLTKVYPSALLQPYGQSEGMVEIHDLYQNGVSSFYNYKKGIANSQILKLALQYGKRLGVVIQSFPEDPTLALHGLVNESATTTALGLRAIPAMAEYMHLQRDIELLKYTGGKLHIPCISTEKSVELIQKAKKEGLDLSCSVAIHHLCLDDSALEEYDSNYKLKPPLRSKSDQKALIKGIKNGSIDMVTTDHFPLNIELKKQEFGLAEYGSLGLEGSFGILNRLLGAELSIKMLTAAYQRFTDQIPIIAEGKPANLSFFTTDDNAVLSKDMLDSKSKNAALLGQILKGTVLGCYANKKQLLNF
ncbi:MAG: dihydroorotase [Flavobacteriaceae bacterium]|nr:dihydroorotase [Flavobacteriaceae bacterium]